MRSNAIALLRALACALLVVCHGAAPAVAHGGMTAVYAAADSPPEEKSCRQGARTKAFGWLLVDYGFATAKYVVGLFLIPIGLLLVCVGVVVEVVEAIAC